MGDGRLNASGVKPGSLPIAELLEKRAPFRVPRYQRPYDWDTDRVLQFVEDINNLLEQPQDSAERRDHFFGSMVAILSSDHTQATTQVHEVVDGQQRLTTFFLLISNIASAATRMAEAAAANDDHLVASRLKLFAQETTEKYLFYDRYDLDNGTKVPEPRLTLSKADDAKFRSILEGKSQPGSGDHLRDSHRKLQEASDILHRELIEKIESGAGNPSEKFDALLRLRDALLMNAFVIHVVTEDRGGGYRLFSVLNDRGKRLAVADLLRSHTLELLDGFVSVQDKAAQLWDDLLVEGGELADEFLKAYYPSLTGRRLNQEKLFSGFEELLFSKPAKSQDEANELLDKIGSMARDYRSFVRIKKGSWPYDNPQVDKWDRSRIRRLTVLLKHELAHPLLIAASASEDQHRFAELVHLIERFAFRYKNICGGHATPAMNRYYKAAVAIRDSNKKGQSPNLSELRKELSELIEERASAEKFKERLKESLRYEMRGSRANLKEFLTTVDDYWKWLANGANGKPIREEMAVIDIDKVTIEHIYPQNAKAEDRDPALEAVKNDLGNLTFFGPSENSSAGNKNFAAKKQTFYKGSKVSMNGELASLPCWDKNQYDSRLNRLLDFGCTIFSAW